MTPPEEQKPAEGDELVEDDDIVEVAQSFFSQLPAPLATDLAMVAGILAAHPRRHTEGLARQLHDAGGDDVA